MILEFWKKFKSGLFTRTQFVTGVMIFFLTCSAVIYAFEAIVGLNTFSSGQPISAAQMNDNFNKINQAMINLKYHKKFAVGVSLNTTFDSSSDYLMEFGTTFYDSTGYAYATSLINSQQFTIRENGVYEFSAITFDSDSNNSIMYKIHNFTTEMGDIWFGSSFDNTPSYGAKAIYINSGTAIQIRAQSWTGYDLVGSKFKLMMKKIE